MNDIHSDGHNPELKPGDYARFNRLLLERCGMYFSESRQAELMLGVRQAFAASTCTNLDQYYRLLQDPKSGAVEMDRLINAVTVSETHFFRNQPQFDALYQHVLPEIIRRRRALRTMRIWSAGCASGEEPYSIAIMLRELLPDVEDWSITILATDINNEALYRARKAVFGEWAFREERAKLWRPRYFRPLGKEYELNPEVRRMVTLSRLNLADDNYPSYETNTTSMDLILCRNVTIYFSESVTRMVVERFYNALVDGGWLVVGHAEPSVSVYARYETYNYPDTVLYRRNSKHIPLDLILSPQWQPEPLTHTATEEGITPSPSPAIDMARAADPFEQAQQLSRYGHSEQAQDVLLDLVESRPGDARVLTLLGQTYANLGNWSQAEYWCSKAVELDKLDIDAYYTLALVYQHQGEVDQAIDYMKKVVYLQRDNVLGHFGLADLYRDKGLWAQAQKSLDNARRLLDLRSDDELIPRSGGVTVRSLRETVVRQQQRWSVEAAKVM